MKSVWLALECLLLFIGIPFAIRVTGTASSMVPVLVLITVAAVVWLPWRYGHTAHHLWIGPDRRAERQHLARVLWRFAFTAPLLALLLWAVHPDLLLELPRENTRLWATLLITYPALSVYPQELLYRAFFFFRYRPLFLNPLAPMVASALAFSWGHIIYGNPWAVSFTLVGGLYFADTYRRTESIRLVWLEHSLYGFAIFTIGWARFFLSGST